MLPQRATTFAVLCVLASPLAAGPLLPAQVSGMAAAGPAVFNRNKTHLGKLDHELLLGSGYRFDDQGRLFEPGLSEPVEETEFFYILEDVRSSHSLKALMEINLIFSRNNWAKNLPLDDKNRIREIGKKSWPLMSKFMRKRLARYFGDWELAALNQSLEGATSAATFEGVPASGGMLPDAVPYPIDTPLETLAGAVPILRIDAFSDELRTGGDSPVERMEKREETYRLKIEERKRLAAEQAKDEAERRAAEARAPAPQSAASHAQTPQASAPAAPVELTPLQERLIAGGYMADPRMQAPAADAGVSAEAAWIPTAPREDAPAAAPTSFIKLPAASKTAPAAYEPPAAEVPAGDLRAIRAAAALVPDLPPPPPAAPVQTAALPPSPAPAALRAPAPPQAPAASLVQTPAAEEAAPKRKRRTRRIEYPEFDAARFETFLKSAPYGEREKNLMRLLSKRAPGIERRSALGVVTLLLPHIVIDSRKAGTDFDAAIAAGEGGRLQIALHDGPVIVQHGGLFGKDSAVVVPDDEAYYKLREIPMPSWKAMSRENAPKARKTQSVGAVRLYEDGSARIERSDAELAGSLLHALLMVDAGLRGWEDDALHSRLRAYTAEMSFYKTLEAARETPRLSLGKAGLYEEWRDRPEDFLDFMTLWMAKPGRRHEILALKAAKVIPSEEARQSAWFLDEPTAKPASPTPGSEAHAEWIEAEQRARSMP